MDKDNKNLHNENSIVNSLKSGFGYDMEQFLDEFHRAEQNPDTCDDILGLQNLCLRLEKSGFFDKKDGVDELTKKKFVRLKSAGKILLVAAVLFTLVMMSGIGVIGQKSFEYQPIIKSNQNENIIWDNSKNLEDINDVEKAYGKIKETLGIRVLRLNYVPPELVFSELKINKGHAIIEFNYGDKKLFLTQVKYAVENSDGYVSDRINNQIYKKIYNEWLDRTFTVRKNNLSDGSIEYEAELYEDNVYYYISGILDEEVFLKIIEDLAFGT